MKPHRDSIILILGILSLIICAPLGVFAWVMGRNDLKEMDAGAMDPSGRANTKAGKICGMISTILLLIGLGIGVVVLGLMIVFGALAAGHAH